MKNSNDTIGNRTRDLPTWHVTLAQRKFVPRSQNTTLCSETQRCVLRVAAEMQVTVNCTQTWGVAHQCFCGQSVLLATVTRIVRTGCFNKSYSNNMQLFIRYL
jgi:hypothetical protein